MLHIEILLKQFFLIKFQEYLGKMYSCSWVLSKAKIFTCYLENLEQNREIQLNWTVKEKFDAYLCVLLNCYCQGFISGTKIK